MLFLNKILILIILSAIAVRLYVLAMLPDAALNDSIYHLILIKGMVEGNISLASVNLPAFYAFSYFIMGSSTVHFIKAVPIILSVAYLILLYLFLKEVIPKNILPAFAFASITSWTLIYGSVNYTGFFAGVLVLLTLLLFAKLVKTKNEYYLLGLMFSIPMLILSKLNGTLVALALFFVIVCYLIKTSLARWKIVFIFVAFTALLSYAWFLSKYYLTGKINYLLFSYGGLKHLATEQVVRADLVSTFLLSYLEFWNYPPIEVGNYAWLFVLVLLPVITCIIYGTKVMLQKKKWIYYAVLAAILINWAIPFKAVFLNANQLFDWGRYLIPSLALYSIPFAIGFSGLKPLAKKIVLLSFIFLAAYSLSYSVYFAYFFNGVYTQHTPLYDYAAKLPKDTKIFSSNQDRQITFFSDREASFLLGSKPFDFEVTDTVEIYNLLRGHGYQYLAITCYREFWKEEAMEGFERSELFEEIYTDDCSKVYGVKK